MGWAGSPRPRHLEQAFPFPVRHLLGELERGRLGRPVWLAELEPFMRCLEHRTDRPSRRVLTEARIVSQPSLVIYKQLDKKQR